MKPMKTKYLFWDFNGTILDDLDLSINLLNEILINESKAIITKEKYLEIFDFPLKNYYQKAGIYQDEENFKRIANYFIENYQPRSLYLSLHDDVEETLKFLKRQGIKNICLSASEKNNLIAQLKHYKIDHYFEEIIGTDNIIAIGKEKLGLKYLKENKIDSNEVIYLGDTTYDYQISHLMGVKCVLFTGGHNSVKRLKDTNTLLIRKISDIINIIEIDK